VKVSTFPWRDDFSAARNFSLDLATLPWILVLDADEVFLPADRVALTTLLKHSEASAYSLTQRNYVKSSGKLTWTESWKPNRDAYKEGQNCSGYLDVPVVRLFPRRSEIRFRGCVHESVEESLAKAGLQIKASGLVLHHYGQVRGPERMKQKKQLYLELGLQKLKKNPSPRARFEVGI
jgi:O-antigen biosynthesis protein